MGVHSVALGQPNAEHLTNVVCTTKYTVWSFVPKCIFQQFYQLANVYFLVTAVLQCIPSISRLHPLTAVAPLVLVLVIAMVKEGIEDWKRRR
jgi:hypothetical protein